MSISGRLREDLNASLKSGAKERAGALRLLLSELYNKGKDKQAKGEKPVLSEEEETAVLQRETKKRKEAIELFRKGNREDLAKKDEAELKVIGEYLPPELDPKEIKAVVDRLFAAGHKEFNALMRETMKELKGRVDGREVSEIVKEALK